MQPQYSVVPDAEIKEENVALDPDTKTFVISSDALDSAKDIVLQNFDLGYFKQNPVFLPFHKRTELPIGKWTRIWTEKIEGKENDLGEQAKRTLGRVKFLSESLYPYAALIKRFYDEKIMSAVSIGFQPIKFREISEELRSKLGMSFWSAVFDKSALKEVSAVDVGANPDALEIRRTKMLDSCIEQGFVDKAAKGVKIPRSILEFPAVMQKGRRPDEVKEWLDGIETEFDESIVVLMDEEPVTQEQVSEALKAPSLDTKDFTAALSSLATKVETLGNVVDVLTIKLRENIIAQKEDSEIAQELEQALALPESERVAQSVLKVLG